VVLRKRLARSEWLALMANLPPLRIGMEACGSAHDWARCVREHGHDVRLIAPRINGMDSPIFEEHSLTAP
jgi:transposase